MAATDGGVRVRDAGPADLDFISWVMLAASRSHLQRGIWEYLFDIDESDALRYLAHIAMSDSPHLFHHSLFQIAEVDGVAAAAMCGFDPATQGQAAYLPAASRAAKALGFCLDAAFDRRVEVLVAGFPPAAAERPWVIENVATRPEYRRRGLVDLLLRETLERGRALGFEQAQIAVYLGNEPARAAYLKAGFAVVDEARDPRWDAEIGCPGAEQLLQSLTRPAADRPSRASGTQAELHPLLPVAGSPGTLTP